MMLFAVQSLKDIALESAPHCRCPGVPVRDISLVHELETLIQSSIRLDSRRDDEC